MASPRPSAASLFGWSSLAIGVLAVLLYGAWPHAVAPYLPNSSTGDGEHSVDMAKQLKLVSALLGSGRLAELSTDEARLQRAEDLLAELLERQPPSAEAHRLLGLLELARGEVEQARRALERSLEIAPDRLSTLLALGASHAAEEDHAAAEPIFRRAVELHPDSIAAHDNLGQTLWLLGREEEALEVYRRKIEIRQMTLGASDGPAAGVSSEAGISSDGADEGN